MVQKEGSGPLPNMYLYVNTPEITVGLVSTQNPLQGGKGVWQCVNVQHGPAVAMDSALKLLVELQ